MFPSASTSISTLAGTREEPIVAVVRVAPAGDPIEVQIGEDRLSLRGAEAREIEVERLP